MDIWKINITGKSYANLINYTYLVYILNPLLLQVVEWTDIGQVESTNGTTHMPPSLELGEDLSLQGRGKTN